MLRLKRRGQAAGLPGRRLGVDRLRFDLAGRTALIWQKWKRSSKMAYGLFLVHLKPFFLPGYLSGI